MNKPRWNVMSKPSPEYLAGRLNGRMGIYAAVAVLSDTEVMVYRVFDGWDSYQSRRDAYSAIRRWHDGVESPPEPVADPAVQAEWNEIHCVIMQEDDDA